MTVLSFFLVGVGGSFGAMLRHAANIGAAHLFGPGLPWGTLFVNVAGSLAMGLLVGGLLQMDNAALARDLRLLLATGVLGGFTTFSAFSLDTWLLWDERGAGIAMAYAAGSVLLSVAGLAAGLVFWRGLA
jgi:fluoride exporter